MGGDFNKMRILMMIIKWQGGHGTVAKGLKKELEKRGHFVHVISRDDDGYTKFGLRDYVKYMGQEYDIIYTFDWSIAFPLLFPYPVYFKKHYCLFHGHQPNKLKFLQTMIGKFMGKKLFVVGDTLKDRFPKSTLVYNGVDFENFNDLGYKRTYLGWIDRDYDMITKEEVIELGKKLNIPTMIIKDIPYELMNKFYNNCDTFISMPPPYTGFNMAWLEAKAAGVKKILGNNNGIGNKLDTLDLNDFTWGKNVDKLLEVWNGY